MTQAERIISKFGTQGALASAIKIQQSAVAAWKKRGFIPTRQQQRIMDAAKRLEIPLTAEDFFESAA